LGSSGRSAPITPSVVGLRYVLDRRGAGNLPPSVAASYIEQGDLRRVEDAPVFLRLAHLVGFDIPNGSPKAIAAFEALLLWQLSASRKLSETCDGKA
jgi:hypothetical protein